MAIGAGLIATSFIIPEGELVEEGIYCGPGAGFLCNPEYKNDDIKSAVFIGGGLTMLGSIPLFIISNRNKRKAGAASVFFKMEKAPLVEQNVFRNLPYPALGIKIGL